MVLGMTRCSVTQGDASPVTRSASIPVTRSASIPVTRPRQPDREDRVRTPRVNRLDRRPHPAALPRWVAVVVVLLAAVVGSWSFAASPASAHAVLTSVDPADGADLEVAPDTVTLTFNEPVEVPTGALRVFDADARRVDVGVVDTGDAAVVSVALPSDLPDGGYVVTYRVISTDAHPIGGVTTFTVGDATAVDDATVGALAAGAEDGAARPLGIALRGLGYLAVLLAGGAALFAASVARQGSDRAAARQLAIRAALVGIGVTLLSLPVQAAALTGDGLSAALSTTTLGEVIGSTFGVSALTRVFALVWLVRLWRARTPTMVPAIIGLAAVASFALDGHQRSVDPTWFLIGADIVHLAAAASWFGGLVLLAGALRRRSLDDDPVEAAGLVSRFSSVALVSFALVTLGGIAMAVPLVGSPAALTGTTYGRLLLAKTAAVAVVVLLAFYNRQRLVPAIAARLVPAGGSVDTPALGEDRRSQRARTAWSHLRRTVRIEAGVLIGVLLVTGWLVATQPASEAAGFGGLYETTAPLGDDLEVDVVVDPNQVGRNTIHLYVLDETGRPSTDVDDLVFELTYLPEDIGPIPIEPFFAGPGHWVAVSDELVFAGDWELRVVAGLDRFTELSAEVTVPVAR
jgi:copper transport protein